MQKIVQKVCSLGVGGQQMQIAPIKIYFPIQKAKKGELVSKKWINWVNVLFEWFLQIHILHLLLPDFSLVCKLQTVKLFLFYNGLTQGASLKILYPL